MTVLVYLALGLLLYGLSALLLRVLYFLIVVLVSRKDRRVGK